MTIDDAERVTTKYQYKIPIWGGKIEQGPAHRADGFRLFGGPPGKLDAMLNSEIAKWADIAERAGMTAK